MQVRNHCLGRAIGGCRNRSCGLGARACSKELLAASSTHALHRLRPKQEALDPDPDAYQCFNDFFVRKLKPEARPIAAPGNPGVIASAADCR